MKYLILLWILTVSLVGSAQDQSNVKTQLAALIDNWHKAAAEANFTAYFDAMSGDAIYIGTDATEYWNITEFKAFAKPYFDRGKAWNFTAIERNIYLTDDPSLVYFDELLNTQMKICRGSGILKKQNGHWKIAHYVLSMTIPNDQSAEVIKIKSAFDDSFLTNRSKSGR